MRKKKEKLHLSDLLTGLMYTIIFIGTICYLMSCGTMRTANKSLSGNQYMITCSNDTIPGR